jgi:zinc transporter 1/2/3
MVLSRLAFDVLAALVLGATAAAGAVAPLLLAARDRGRGGAGRSLAFVLGNMVSAGVMVSAGFCHLLGEALKQMPPSMFFPMAPFLCGLGFLLTLCADRAAAALSGADERPPAPVELAVGLELAERGGGGTPKRGGIGGGGGGGGLGGGGGGDAESAALLGGNGGGGGGNGDALLSGGAAAATGRRALPGAAVPAQRASSRSDLGPSSFESDLAAAAAAAAASTPTPPRLRPPAPHQHPGQNAHAHSHSHHHGPGGPRREASFLTSVLMAGALCFHSLLEGAAMGAQPTVSNSMHIFIAIVSHKGLAAYALGSSLVEAGLTEGNRAFWGVAGPFTAASPAGIFVGLVLSGAAAGVVRAVCCFFLFFFCFFFLGGGGGGSLLALLSADPRCACT